MDGSACLVESESHSVVLDSLRPHRLYSLWNSLGQKWVTFLVSRGSSQPMDQTQVFLIAGRFFTIWATREAHCVHVYDINWCVYPDICFHLKLYCDKDGERRKEKGKTWECHHWDFPGGPVAETPNSQRGAWVWSLVRERAPTCCKQQLEWVKVAQLCLTLFDPKDYTVHWII